ncbi:hypothetical protein N9W17_04160 [Jannaschia sp.]|nr:hypothetical protein [Jannaschia sp.]
MSTRFIGKIDSVRAQIVDGWIIDTSNPGHRLSVRAVAEDGTVLGEGVAERMRGDLAKAGFGNGYHGFWIKVQVPQGQPEVTVQMREVETGHLLGSATVKAGIELTGRVDGVKGQIVDGWIMDKSEPERRLSVRAVAGDGTVLGEGVAERMRGDLAKAGFGSGHHGFWIKVQVPQGQPEVTVQMREVETGHVLGTVSVEAGMDLTGKVDGVKGQIVDGWIVDRSNPERRLSVRAVAEDGTVLGEGAAERMREDLAKKGFGSGHHGFRIKVQVPKGQAKVAVQMREVETGHVLGTVSVAAPKPIRRKRADFGGTQAIDLMVASLPDIDLDADGTPEGMLAAERDRRQTVEAALTLARIRVDETSERLFEANNEIRVLTRLLVEARSAATEKVGR